MRVLVFGPSGSGKTYISNTLASAGINAFDTDKIEGLSNWYNKDGKKVTAPTTADEALHSGYAFLWSKKVLSRFLAQFPEVFIFGGAGNVANLFELFDKVYFLKIDPNLQRQRLNSSQRPTPHLDKTREGTEVIWGDWLEQLALSRQIPFIDAAQSPQEIYSIISSKLITGS